MKRFLWLTAGFLLWAAAPVWAQKQLVDRVIAVINDEAITQSELDIFLRPFYEDLKKQYGEQELVAKLNEIRLKLLNQMIEDRLVSQEAKNRGITVDETEIDEMVREVKTRFPTEQEFEKTLLAEGQTLAELREHYRRQLSVRKLHDMEIRAQVVVSPREIEEYYNLHSFEFTDEEKMKIRSITLRKTQEAVEKGITDEEARKKIESVEKRIRAGEAFETLARQYSEDDHAKEGGLVGWIKRGEMLASIDESLFELKEGSISPVLETDTGYHLFKIEEKKVPKIPTLDEVREKIHSVIYRQKAEKRFKEWMDQLKARAYISIR